MGQSEGRAPGAATAAPWWALLLVGIAATLAAAVGTPVRGSSGGQTTGDEPQYLLTALSLAEDGNLDIGDELSAERWRDFHEAQLPEQTRLLPDGRRVSPHDPLLPLLLAPAMRWGGWVAAKLVLAGMSGLLAAAMLWTATARFAVPTGVASATVGVFALSAPLSVYGTQVYPELPAALVVTAAIAVLTGRLRRPGLLALSACVVALPWLAIKYAPVAAALAVLGLWRLARDGRRRTAVGVATVLVGAGVMFAAVHQLVWTGWTPYASADHFIASGEFGVVGFSPDYAGRGLRLIGLLVGQRFGLAAWQPAWLLLLPAIGALARRRPPSWTVLALPLLIGWLNATFVALTMRGWWFPGRQVVVILPAAVLAVAWWAGRHRGVLLAAVILGAVGVWSYGWLVIEGVAGRVTWAVDFFATRNPVYLLWRQALPDYLDPGPRVVLLHVVWSLAGVAAVLWGWRSARPAAAVPAPAAGVVAHPRPNPSGRQTACDC